METTKRCPFCAEEIQAAAIKCRHCGSELSNSTAPVPCAPPPLPSTTPRQLICAHCNLPLIQIQSRKFFSAGGCVGSFLILVGIISCLTIIGFGTGLVLMALGALVGAVGAKKTVMACPSCGRRGEAALYYGRTRPVPLSIIILIIVFVLIAVTQLLWRADSKQQAAPASSAMNKHIPSRAKNLTHPRKPAHPPKPEVDSPPETESDQ